MRSALLMLSLCFATAAHAQEESSYLNDEFVALLRADVQANAREVMAYALQLSDAEGAAFWPIYDDYIAALRPIGDERLRLLERLDKGYDKMSDDEAADLADSALAWDAARSKARAKTYKQVVKAVGGIRAAQFLQIDREIQLLIDLQISSESPLIQLPKKEKPPVYGP